MNQLKEGEGRKKYKMEGGPWWVVGHVLRQTLCGAFVCTHRCNSVGKGAAEEGVSEKYFATQAIFRLCIIEEGQ